jgi:3',5'-cyclic AMP phosphodiesterase CpdA
MGVSRRELLAGGAALALAPIAKAAGSSARQGSRFRFVHFTDPHIQPELGADLGVARAVQKVLSLSPRPVFVVTGGDHVMDVNEGTRERTDLQFRLLNEALKPLEMPVYAAIGNHDIYGWSGGSAASETDPMYGKRMFEERFAKHPTYFSFDHKGWHFVILDSVQAPKARDWHGRIDDDQLTWLANDLEKTGKRPSIVATHIPILTLFPQYADGTTKAPSDKLIVANGKEVQALLQKHPVKVVLQGHTHVVEACDYLGTRYITGGAVSGEWWKGPRLGVHHEGFMVYDVDGADVRATYTPYGWTARA